MGRIIEPTDFKGRIGNNDQQKFSIELKDGKNIDLIFNGDHTLLIQMLYDVMQAHPVIASTLITAILIFADQKKISIEELRKHSFFNQNLKL